MREITFYEYEKHYDFIKSDEAKEIFLNLKKEIWLKSNFYDEEDLKRHFSYDEEKKDIVEHFALLCSGWGDRIKISRKQEYQNRMKLSYQDFEKFESEFVNQLSMKKKLDPEYIYEHWQAEKLRFLDEMDRVCKDKNNEKYYKQNEFILDSL